MRRILKRKKCGFTLPEILITVAILALLAVLIIPRLTGWIYKAGQAEGMVNLGAIRSAELLIHQLAGRFREAEDHPAIQSALDLIVGDKFYSYQVVEASEEDFLALAIPNWPYNQWLEEMSINKDGFVNPPIGLGSYPGSGTGGGSSSGGSSGGGSGGGPGSGGGGGPVLIPVGPGGGGSGNEPIIVPIPESGISPSIQIPSPKDLQLTANDGWITMSWTQEFSNVTYRVYEAQEVGGVIGPFSYANEYFESNSFRSPVWDDQVENGKTYCYRVTTVFEGFESQPSDPPVCASGSSDSDFAEKAQATKDMLAAATEPILGVDGVTNGTSIVDALDANNIPFLFGPTPPGYLAYQNPVTKSLVFSNAYQDAPVEVVTAILAHEAVHSIWNGDYDEYLNQLKPEPELGMPIPGGGIRSPNSIDQEYRGFLSAAQVWRTIKGSLTDAEMDSIEDFIFNLDGTFVDEDIAKETVRQRYLGILTDEY